MTLTKVFIAIAVFAVGSVVYNKLQHGANSIGTDRNMDRVVADINQHLPMQLSADSVAERVEYANHVMRYFVTLNHGQEMSESDRTQFQQTLKQRYCALSALVKAEVGVDYEIKKVGLRSMSDKLKNETWTFSVRPSECQ